MDIPKEIAGGNPSSTTKRRWDNLFRYVLNDGSFPLPPVVMRRPEGLSPIDGTHSMAVLSGLRQLPEAAFTAKKMANRRTSRTSGWANTRTAGFRTPSETATSALHTEPEPDRFQSPRNHLDFGSLRGSESGTQRWSQISAGLQTNSYFTGFFGENGKREGNPTLCAIHPLTAGARSLARICK
jgi:hypothetical protein